MGGEGLDTKLEGEGGTIYRVLIHSAKRGPTVYKQYLARRDSTKPVCKQNLV